MSIGKTLKKVGQYHDPIQMGKMAKDSHDRGVPLLEALHDPPGKITGWHGKKTQKELDAAKAKKRAERFARAGMTPPKPMKKGGKVTTKKMKCGGKTKHVKKMAKGGKVPCCRGMGAAVRGGKFGKNG